MVLLKVERLNVKGLKAEDKTFMVNKLQRLFTMLLLLIVMTRYITNTMEFNLGNMFTVKIKLPVVLKPAAVRCSLCTFNRMKLNN